VTHEQVWRPNAGPVQERVQLPHDLTQRSRPWAQLTPSKSAAIVRADAREACDVGLYEAPIH
jgi:hypothetical protein